MPHLLKIDMHQLDQICSGDPDSWVLVSRKWLTTVGQWLDRYGFYDTGAIHALAQPQAGEPRARVQRQWLIKLRGEIHKLEQALAQIEASGDGERLERVIDGIERLEKQFGYGPNHIWL